MSGYTLHGGQGDDRLSVGDDSTSLNRSFANLNKGDDTTIIHGAVGSSLRGGQGNDTINTSSANVGVVMQGDAGDDQLSGGSGVDTFLVNAGNDIITNVGQGGADVIHIAAGANGSGTVTADWIATTSVNNQGLGTLISGAAGININLELASGSSGWALRDNTGDEVLFGSAQNDTI